MLDKDKVYVPNFDKDYYYDELEDSLNIKNDILSNNKENSVVKVVEVQEESLPINFNSTEQVVVKERTYCEDYSDNSKEVLCVKVSRYRARSKMNKLNHSQNNR